MFLNNTYTCSFIYSLAPFEIDNHIIPETTYVYCLLKKLIIFKIPRVQLIPQRVEKGMRLGCWSEKGMRRQWGWLVYKYIFLDLWKSVEISYDNRSHILQDYCGKRIRFMLIVAVWKVQTTCPVYSYAARLWYFCYSDVPIIAWSL